MNECGLAPIRRAICCRAASDCVVAPPPTLSNRSTNAKVGKHQTPRRGAAMKKTIIVAAATVIVGAVAFKPVPAAAFFWVPIIMESKKDKNFKAVNPYGPKKAKASKKKR
jgi:hypothetical protein